MSLAADCGDEQGLDMPLAADGGDELKAGADGVASPLGLRRRPVGTSSQWSRDEVSAASAVSTQRIPNPDGGSFLRRIRSFAPATPERAGYALACTAALVLCFALVVHDLWVGGLGTSNSKFVSLVASLASCVDFRAQKPQNARSGAGPAVSFHATSPAPGCPGRWQAVISGARVLCGQLWAKFGSATVGSLLLGEMPVILKGPRHFATFLLALVLVQACPGDAVYRLVQTSAMCQLVARLGAALYKLRKLVFVILACRGLSLRGPAPFAVAPNVPGPLHLRLELALYSVVVAWVITDGNSVLRAVDTWMRCRGFPRKQDVGSGARVLSILASEAGAGLLYAARRFSLLAAVSFGLVLCDAWAPAMHLALRGLAFAVLLHRHKVPTAALDAMRAAAEDTSDARAAVSRAAGEAAIVLSSLAPAAAEYVLRSPEDVSLCEHSLGLRRRSGACTSDTEETAASDDTGGTSEGLIHA